MKEARGIEKISVSEFDLLLSKVFIHMRKQMTMITNWLPERLSENWFNHIINIFLTELGRSLWDNLDLGHAYRTNAVRSVLHDDLGQYFFIQISHSVMRTK